MRPTCSGGCEEYRDLTRRQFLGAAATGGAVGFLGLLHPEVLLAAPGRRATARSVILLWMAGGQSHLDTWDPKPGTDTGGPFAAIETAAKGIRIGEHLPLLGREFADVSLIRSLTSSEGSHERATYLLHTGYKPTGSFQHSPLGSVIAKMKGRYNPDLPPFVAIGGRTFPAGYLGSEYAAYHIANPDRPTENLAFHHGVDAERFSRRRRLLQAFDEKFYQQHKGKEVIEAYARHYDAAYAMMRSKSVSAFNLAAEPDSVRQRYGETFFGQGCLLARRLAEVGIRFIEVTLPGWDTHQDNFETVKALCADLDQAVSALIDDLRRKELLHQTLIVLCGEFGRTPRINNRSGRDHWPRVWSAVLAGGGIKGGRIVGRTTDGGEEAADDPCSVGQLHATICKCLDIDPHHINYADDGRPIRIVADTNAKPIDALF